MFKVNVYHDGEIVGRVVANNNLDKWNGNNWCWEKVGYHLGITKLKKPIDGKSFVLIHTFNYPNKEDYGELISDKKALKYILESEDDDLLKKYFPNYNVDLEVEE